jgi:hypothetical protein
MPTPVRSPDFAGLPLEFFRNRAGWAQISSAHRTQHAVLNACPGFLIEPGELGKRHREDLTEDGTGYVLDPGQRLIPQWTIPSVHSECPGRGRSETPFHIRAARSGERDLNRAPRLICSPWYMRIPFT